MNIAIDNMAVNIYLLIYCFLFMNIAIANMAMHNYLFNLLFICLSQI